MAIRIGILGSGGIARTHAKRLGKIRGAAVVAVCGRKRENAEKVSQDTCDGKAQAFDDFQTMIAESKLDALYVCIPPYAHEGQVEFAAKKGVHLFLEKPIAITPERALSQVKAIEKAGVHSQVGYHMRFAAGVVKLKKMLDSGKAGAPTLMQAAYLCNALYSPWWRDKKRSGGQVLEQMIHVYDLTMYFLGAPRTVCGFAENLQHKAIKDYTVEDTSAAIIQFKSGAMASLVGSNAALPLQWLSPFRVVCKNVVADFASLHEAKFTHTGGEPSEYYWNKGTKPETTELTEEVDCYLEENKYFIRTLQGKAPEIAPAREGWMGVKLTSAVFESAKAGGKPVKI